MTNFGLFDHPYASLRWAIFRTKTARILVVDAIDDSVIADAKPIVTRQIPLEPFDVSSPTRLGFELIEASIQSSLE